MKEETHEKEKEHLKKIHLFWKDGRVTRVKCFGGISEKMGCFNGCGVLKSNSVPSMGILGVTWRRLGGHSEISLVPSGGGGGVLKSIFTHPWVPYHSGQMNVFMAFTWGYECFAPNKFAGPSILVLCKHQAIILIPNKYVHIKDWVGVKTK